MIHLRVCLLNFFCALPLLNPAYLIAAEFPVKPIRMVVGFPPSGISDNLARVLAKAMGDELGQPIYIDNRPGAGTTIAADNIAKSAPDGYSIFMQDLTSHAINASLYPKLPYYSVKSFTPIMMVASTPLVMVVPSSSSINNISELVAEAKSNPGKLNYGSSGIGAILHLAGELFLQKAGITMTHIPYKGATGAVNAMLGGEVAMSFATMPTAVPLVKAGRITAVAVTSNKRVSSLPNIPTVEEGLGFREYDVVLYNGILGPPGMPKVIVDRLRVAISKALETSEVKAFYVVMGADVMATTPDEFNTHLTKEIATYSKLVKQLGVKAE